MAHVTDTSVARQATFDTDPDRARIKRVTLKLPVIRTEDTPRVVEQKVPNNSEKKVPENKHKPTKAAEKVQAQPDKHEKVTAKQTKASDNRQSEANSVNANTADKHISEKQKRLQALNQIHKTNGASVKEPDSSHKEENKASVLKDLNAKRSNSPEKKTVHQKTPEKEEKEVNNKDVQVKSQKGKKETVPPVLNRDKSPTKREQSPKNEVVKQNNNNPAAIKHIVKNDHNSKDSKTTNQTVKVTSPPQKLVTGKSPDTHKPKGETNDTGLKTTEGPKHKDTKATERNKSPEKRLKSPNDSGDQSAEAGALKNLKSKHHLAPTKAAKLNTAAKKTDETPVPQRGRSPVKKVKSNEDDKDRTEKQPGLTKNNNKAEQAQAPEKETDVALVNTEINAAEKGNLIASNRAPAETKLIESVHEAKQVDGKQVSAQDHSHSVHESKRETKVIEESSNDNDKEIGLTTAFALLVAEGSNHVNEDTTEKDKKESVNLPSSKSGHVPQEVTNGIVENEDADEVPELKDSATNKTGNAIKSESPKDPVRQTYVLSPSPTKSDRGKEPKSPIANVEELKVGSIEIEAKPKGPKMQGKESYEQVYAERNTLLKAEYTFRKRIKQLEDEANGFLRTIEDMTSENRILRDRCDELESKLRNNGGGYEMISKLEREKEKLEGRIKDLESQNSKGNKSGESEESKNEVRDLKAQVIKLQSENQSLNEDNVKLKSENYENVKKLHAAEAEAKSLASSVTAVESEKMDKIQDLKNEHTHFKKENDALKAKNGELTKKVESLEFENASLSETLSQKKNELSEIMTVMKDENRFDNEIKDLKNQVMKLQKEKKDMEATHTKELRIATDALEDLKSKHDKSVAELDEMKIKCDEMEKECKTLKRENSSLTKANKSQEAEIENLKAEIERLKQALKDAREKYDALANESKSNTSDLRSAKETAEELNRDLQKIVSEKENQISKLVAQLDAAKMEKETESQTLLQEKERLQLDNERLKSLETNLDRTEREFKHVSSKLEEAELKKKHLSIQLQDKGFEISNLEQQVFELNMKLDSSARRISQLDKEKRDLEDDRKDWDVKKEKVTDIEASNKRLTEENRRLRSQLEITSYSSDYRTSEHDRDRHVVEAWVSDNSAKPSQHATYVQKDLKEKKKVQIVPHPTNFRKRAGFSKSSPVKSSSKPVVHKQTEQTKNSMRSSRSLEDLSRSPPRKTPDSEQSLPELQKETRLTTYGGIGNVGYSQIHRNRIRAMHKRVY